MSWEPWWPTDSGGSVAASMSDRPEDAAEAFMRRVVGSQRWDRLPERTRVERRSEGVALVGEMTSIRRGRPWNPAEIVCPVVSGHGRGSRPQFERSAHTIGETVRNNCMVAGRYISVRFESGTAYNWRLDSYDLEVDTIGEW